MAKRRMFSLDIIDTDTFLEMPASTQALYFHLGMRADDDGFVSSPKKITMMVNCGIDDLKLLIAKQFVLQVSDGIVVIKDWKINNYIQKDRYTKTRYTKEKDLLGIEDNGSYMLAESFNSDMDTSCVQSVSKTDTQVRLGKSKDSIGKDKEREEEEKGERRGSAGTIKGSSTSEALKGLQLNKSADKRRFSSSFPSDNQFSFQIVQSQISLMYKKLKQEEGCIYELSQIIEIFMMYYDAYQKNTGQYHPPLKNEDVFQIIRNMPVCYTDRGEPLELDTELYEKIIEKHFETDYQGGCDYNILHFMSGQIRTLRYYETCY